MQMIQIFYVKYKYRETNWFSIEEINSMKNPLNLHPEIYVIGSLSFYHAAIEQCGGTSTRFMTFKLQVPTFSLLRLI